MKFALLTKRQYTNKDLLHDRFGRLFHLPYQLSKIGNDGIVITGDLHSKQTEILNINSLKFHSIPLSLVRLPQFIKKTYNLLKNFKPDVLLASGDSYLGYLGLKLARKLKIPFVFDVYDDYTAFGTNKIPGMKSLFYKAVHDADIVMTAGESLCNLLKHRSRAILNIENGYDPNLFHPIPVEEARQISGIPSDEIVIGYFGSLEPKLGIEDLIEASKLLREQIPKVRLLIAGKDNLKFDYASYNIDYRGFLPQRKIPVLINTCDVVVIPYLPSKMKKCCNACKIAEYAACHKPIVATDIADHSTLFASTPQSICEPGDSRSMAAAIKAQIKSPQILKFPAHLTWIKLAVKFNHSLEELLKKY